MKVSIVIPQLFYDLISRILPGILFLSFIMIFMPNVFKQIIIINISGAKNFIDSIGYGVLITIYSYFLGWLFNSLSFISKEDKIFNEKKGDNESITPTKIKERKTLSNKKYHWVRLNNLDAGFRIVKLRAEARMLEAVQFSMILFVLIYLIYIIYNAFIPAMNIDRDSTQRIMMMITAFIMPACFFTGCFFHAEKAWQSYWGNIDIIYDILHDKNDRVIKKRIKRYFFCHSCRAEPRHGSYL
jgi:hypothetical protein